MPAGFAAFLIFREDIKVLNNHSVTLKFGIFVAGVMKIPVYWVITMCRYMDICNQEKLAACMIRVVNVV